MEHSNLSGLKVGKKSKSSVRPVKSRISSMLRSKSSEKKRVSTRCFFNSFFFRQLLFFGSMFFKLAVTLQKDAPGDTDHGERLSGQKY